MREKESEGKRRGGQRPGGTKSISLRFTPDDTAIVQNLASRAIAAGEDPLKINTTTIIRAALRVARDIPTEILLAAMLETRAD